MNKMRKVIVFTMVCVCLTLCAVPSMDVNAASVYSFKSKGVKATPGKSAADFIKANRRYYVGIKNSKSCVASSGYDVTREYKYFTLVTYSSKKNGKGKNLEVLIMLPKEKQKSHF